MPRPYLYLIFITAQTSRHNLEPQTRCAGEEVVPSTCVGDARPCAGRGAVGPYGPVPPCPSDHAKSEQTRSALALAAVGALSSGTRDTTAIRASALGAPVNELIDDIFGCYPSSKGADVVPKGAPTIWHKSTACHFADALKML
jgi:hypothetical protein